MLHSSNTGGMEHGGSLVPIAQLLNSPTKVDHPSTDLEDEGLPPSRLRLRKRV